MRKFLLLALLLAALPAQAADNFAVTPGTGVTLATKDLSSVHIPKHNIVNQAGAEMGLAAAPWIVSGPGTAGTAATGVLTVQGIASMTPILATLSGTNNVTNAGTFVTQATLAAETTKVIGTVRNLGNIGAVIDFAGQNAASPANAWLTGCQFNTTPTTITSGNASPCQLDNAGNLKVNVATGTMAVTNAGTFAVQIAANSAVNVAQINGVTTLMGNGATGTGSQRVTIANDNTIPTGWPTGALQTTTNTNLGAPGDTTCATDTGSCALNAKISRLTERVSTLITNVGAAAGATITSTVTRPANTNTYTVNDVWAATTPAVGGSTLTAACRASGTSGMLTDMIIMTSAAPGTLLQGEIWLFDQAVTAVADEAAFALSDAEQAFLIGVVPFTVVANPSNAHKHVTGLNYGYTCVGTANLRYLVKVINAYVGASAEVLTVKAKVMYVD